MIPQSEWLTATEAAGSLQVKARTLLLGVRQGTCCADRGHSTAIIARGKCSGFVNPYTGKVIPWRPEIMPDKQGI